MAMRRLKASSLKLGDIILTTTDEFPSGLIRRSTKADISHAMMYVGHSSIIHAVTNGVHSENIQRIFFKPNLAVHVMRLEGLDPHTAKEICDHVRLVVGTEYSIPEAIRSVTKRGKSFSSKQFCSRLVAQAYEKYGQGLVSNPNYCNPGQLLKSERLTEIAGATEVVSDEEYAEWQQHPSQIGSMADTTNIVLKGARELSSNIQTLQDIVDHLVHHPEHDDEINRLYRTSGYLDVYKPNLVTNPWQFNEEYLEEFGRHQPEKIREYCLGTVSEGVADHHHVRTLHAYQTYQAQHPRKTYQTLIGLYATLVQLHKQRVDIAEKWLDRNGR